MSSTEAQTIRRVLLVDDDASVLEMMSQSLDSKGFEVVAVGGVTEALQCIANEKFDVLITDLHMPKAGDGFTVISAMRHSQPQALTMLLSGFPDVKSAMEAIILEADEIVVKPVGMKQLAALVQKDCSFKSLLIGRPRRESAKYSTVVLTLLSETGWHGSRKPEN